MCLSVKKNDILHAHIIRMNQKNLLWYIRNCILCGWLVLDITSFVIDEKAVHFKTSHCVTFSPNFITKRGLQLFIS